MSSQNAFLLILAIVGLFQSCTADTELTAEKWTQNLAKINKFLVDNEPYEYPELNMERLRRIVKREYSFPRFNVFGSSTMAKTLKILVKLSEPVEQDKECWPMQYKKLDVVHALRSANVAGPSYPKTRLDKIIEHYAFEDAAFCGFPFGWANQLNYDYYVNAYDNINKLLKPTVRDANYVEASMAKVEEMHSKPDASIANALDLLVSLKSTLNEDTCDESGYEILFKNDLATRRNAHILVSRANRATDIMFKQYAIKHEQLCRPVAPKIFQSRLTRLDPHTYDSILGLIVNFYIDRYSFDLCGPPKPKRKPWDTEPEEVTTEPTTFKPTFRLMSELNQKKVDGDFSIPFMKEHFTSLLRSCDDSKLLDLGRVVFVRSETISEFVNARSASHGQTKVLFKVNFNKYIREPCAKFIRVFGRLVEADAFGSNMNDQHTHSSKADILSGGPELTYVTVRAGYYACRSIAQKMYLHQQALDI